MRTGALLDNSSCSGKKRRGCANSVLITSRSLQYSSTTLKVTMEIAEGPAALQQRIVGFNGRSQSRTSTTPQMNTAGPLQTPPYHATLCTTTAQQKWRFRAASGQPLGWVPPPSLSGQLLVWLVAAVSLLWWVLSRLWEQLCCRGSWRFMNRS